VVAALILLNSPSALLVRALLRHPLNEGLTLLLFGLLASFWVRAIVIVIACFVVVPRAGVHDTLHKSAGMAVHHGSMSPKADLIRVG
jgi:hypothetical protein